MILSFFPFCFFGVLDDQKLRALQLNSWQLFRLLQAQLPGLSCRNFPCDTFITNSGSTISECKGSKEKLFCCLYLNAATLHNAWKTKVVIGYVTILLCQDFNFQGIPLEIFVNIFTWHLFCRSNSTEGYNSVVAAYHEFLSSASEWLSHKAIDVCVFFRVKIS